MKTSFLFCFVSVLSLSVACQNSTSVEVVGRTDTSKVNPYYVQNKAPLKSAYFLKLPVGSIQAKGWLRKYLELQRDGLTGHLGEISAWLAKENNAWLSKDGSGDHGWEEVPYWLKGYGNLGYILQDSSIIKNAKTWLDAALNSQRDDGYFGPLILKNGKPDLWGNMIMLWCLQSYFEHSQDERVLPFMEKYFRWQAQLPDSLFLKDYWENSRGGDNLYSIYWLYNRTEGNDWLLELAEKTHRNTADWRQQDNLPNWHNVNIAQCFREPATYYLQSGDKDDLQATYRNFEFIREKYGQVPGGMFGADENAREGFTDPRQGVETCGMVEQMASDELLMAFTGDPFWADHAEEIAFNTYPAAVMPDFKALRYITSPNMTISDSKNHHPGIDNNGPFLMMNPFSSRCCQHNHAQGWPYYAEHLFMATPDQGLAALLYAEADVEALVGEEGQAVQISARGHYPFDERMSYTIQTASEVNFPYYMRIPLWCEQAEISVNGEQLKGDFKGGTYAKITRDWKDGDEISIYLPMKLHTKKWVENKNSLSVQRGPLTYSLKIEEEYRKADSKKSAIGDSKWQKDADPEKWPSFEIFPASAWNYALVEPNGKLEDTFEVIKKTWPADDFPFTLGQVPIEIKAKAKRVENWNIDQYGLTAVLPESPLNLDEKEEIVTLIPMGAARLRISAFPTTK